MLLQDASIGGTALNSDGLNAMRVNEPGSIVYWFADQHLQVSPRSGLSLIVHVGLWNIRCDSLHCTLAGLLTQVD
jgi:hypothetical protein